MKTVDLAIVIPTLNEEGYIGKLLDSIASQTVQPQEIVVVDAFSKDKTIQVIKNKKKILPQLKWFQIKKYTISRQRNFGAAKTKSSALLFLDADTLLLDPKTLEKYLSEVEQKKLSIAAAHNYPLSDYWVDKFYYVGMKIIFESARYVWPMVLTVNLYVKRAVFNKNGGFDNEVKIAEDIELLQRVIRSGEKFKFLKRTRVYTSVRRYETEGRVKMTAKYVRNLAYIHLHGYDRIPDDYKFGHFGKQ